MKKAIAFLAILLVGGFLYMTFFSHGDPVDTVTINAKGKVTGNDKVVEVKAGEKVVFQVKGPNGAIGGVLSIDGFPKSPTPSNGKFQVVGDEIIAEYASTGKPGAGTYHVMFKPADERPKPFINFTQAEAQKQWEEVVTGTGGGKKVDTGITVVIK